MTEQEKEFGERVVARLQEQPCKFDPITILTIVCSLLGLLMNCFHFWYQPGTKLATICESDVTKNRLIRRAAKQYRKQHPELSKADALRIAAATVEEAINTTEEQLTQYAMTIQQPTDTEITFFKGLDDGDE